jgi:hypothetical protein
MGEELEYIAKRVEFPMEEATPCGEGGRTTWRRK